MLPVILKQVQDDEIAAFESRWGGWSLFINRSPEQQGCGDVESVSAAPPPFAAGGIYKLSFQPPPHRPIYAT